jgi:hypothetical protein
MERVVGVKEVHWSDKSTAVHENVPVCEIAAAHGSILEIFIAFLRLKKDDKNAPTFCAISRRIFIEIQVRTLPSVSSG